MYVTNTIKQWEWTEIHAHTDDISSPKRNRVRDRHTDGEYSTLTQPRQIE